MDPKSTPPVEPRRCHQKVPALFRHKFPSGSQSGIGRTKTVQNCAERPRQILLFITSSTKIVVLGYSRSFWALQISGISGNIGFIYIIISPLGAFINAKSGALSVPMLLRSTRLEARGPRRIALGFRTD